MGMITLRSGSASSVTVTVREEPSVTVYEAAPKLTATVAGASSSTVTGRSLPTFA